MDALKGDEKLIATVKESMAENSKIFDQNIASLKTRIEGLKKK